LKDTGHDFEKFILFLMRTIVWPVKICVSMMQVEIFKLIRKRELIISIHC
jgi:hypothetical protein